MDLPLHSAYDSQCLSEVALRVSGRMRERHEHLTCPAAALSDVVLDDRVPAVEAVLVPQSVVDALGGVPLLPGKVEVILEYPVYDPCVRSDLGSSGRLSSSVSRRRRVREHLAYGVSVQTEHTGRFPGAHAVYHAGSSDAKIQFHLVHPSHLPWALGLVPMEGGGRSSFQAPSTGVRTVHEVHFISAVYTDEHFVAARLAHSVSSTISKSVKSSTSAMSASKRL